MLAMAATGLYIQNSKQHPRQRRRQRQNQRQNQQQQQQEARAAGKTGDVPSQVKLFIISSSNRD